MPSWSGYSIAAVILVIIAIIMIIVGIVMYDSTMQVVTPADSKFSWPLFLIIGGVILLIIGIALGYMGTRSDEVTAQVSSTSHYPHPAYGHHIPLPHPAYTGVPTTNTSFTSTAPYYYPM